MGKAKFIFPAGYEDFHKDQAYNFQLNRYYSMGLGRFEDMKDAGQKINSLKEWKTDMVRLAETSVSEGRLMNAAFYYRAAEFYLLRDDPEKNLFYEKFQKYFYEACKDDGINKYEVPYNDTFLAAIQLPPVATKQRGTLVLHGGNDSFIEECYPVMRYFSDHGYEVIAFEGPGQGSTKKNTAFP